MAREVLSIPEEFVPDVTKVIRAGVHALMDTLPDEVIENLLDWCDEQCDEERTYCG